MSTKKNKQKITLPPGRTLVSEAIDYNEFDNTNTILYKLSHNLSRKNERQPIEYILLEKDSADNYMFSTAQIICGLKFQPPNRTSLKEQYKSLSEDFNSLTLFEIAMVYKSVMDLFRSNNIKVYDDEENDLTTEDNILDAINDMFIALTEEDGSELISIKDLSDLNEIYSDWQKSKINKVKAQEEVYNKIMETQEELLEIEPIDHTPPVIETFTYKYMPKISNIYSENKEEIYTPDIEEGIYIFKNAVVSANVPFIQYNTPDEKNLYWVYNNYENNKVESPEVYLDQMAQTTRINTIYIFLWVENIDKNNKGKLIKCIYYVDKGELTLKAPNWSGGLDVVKQNLESALPLLILGEGIQIRVQGYFEVDQITFNDISYYYMLNIDNLHKTYLYIEESVKAWADRPRPGIHYKSFMKTREENGTSSSSVIISFGSFISESEDENIFPETINPSGSNLPHTAGKLRINVGKAESEVVLEQFLKVFCRLLARYRDERENIEELIKSIIPEIEKTSDFEEESEEEEKSKKYKGGETKETKIKNLQRRVPEIFTKTTARKFQNKKQPILIKANEVDEWREYTFKHREKVTNRQVMPFPPLPPDENGEFDDPVELDSKDKRVKYWFVCPDNNFPYPYLKSSVGLPNHEQFPFIPCCGKKENLSNMKSNYYHYHEKNYAASKKGKGKHHMSTPKILKSFGRIGAIGNVLSQLLSSYKSNNAEVFSRFGVPIGTNSLIHCVLVATNNKGYLGLRSDIDREAYANSVRQYMADNLDPSLFKQELYDMSTKEIISKIKDPEVEFGSEKFYRGLEELFGVNIFIFNPGSTPQVRAESEEKLFMEIPRSKILHIRPYREDLPSVLVFKHWGAEIDNKIKYPHCELIISTLPEKEKKEEESEEEEEENETSSGESTFNFGVRMTKIMYRTLMKSTQGFVWSHKEGMKTMSKSEDIITRVNPFSRVDWEVIFKKYPIIGQRVDSYGKMRMLAIQVNDDTVMNICTPPSQPLNLPFIDEITPVEETLAVSILGDPSGVSYNGLWFPAIDYKYCLFIPTLSTKRSESPSKKLITSGEIPPKTSGGISPKTSGGIPPKTSLPRISPVKISPVKTSPTTKPTKIKIQITNKKSAESPAPSHTSTEISRSNADPIAINEFDLSEYRLDLKGEALYTLTADLPDEPVILNVKTTDFPIEDMRLTQRNVLYLIQLIRWLWRLDKENTGKYVEETESGDIEVILGTFEDWWNEWVIADKNVRKHLTDNYQLTIKLPTVTTTYEGLVHLSEMWPTFFRKNKVRLYPELESKLFAFFKREDEVTRGMTAQRLNAAIMPAKFLTGIYLWEDDFIGKDDPDPNKVIFLSTRHLNAWINYQIKRSIPTGTQNIIYRKAEQSRVFEIYPYIYYDSRTQKAFIIQNVQGGELARVFSLCINWKNYSTNLGFSAESYTGEDVPHVIYGISADETLIQIQDNSNEDLEYYHIIRYTERGRYAAMLPII